jgi:hypothetical protein
MQGREHLGDVGADERAILNWILEKSGDTVWIGLCIENTTGLLWTR